MRVWRSSSPLDLGRAFSWLRKRLDFEGGYGGLDATDLRAALRETPDRLRAIADHFLISVPIDNARWLSWHRFREAILFELSSDVLLDRVIENPLRKGDDTQQFLYEVANRLCYQAEQPHGSEVFEWLYTLANLGQIFAMRANKRSYQSCRPIIFEVVPVSMSLHKTVANNSGAHSTQRRRKYSAEPISGGRSTSHRYTLHFIATWTQKTPRERLAAWLGEERVETALAGLRATPSRSDIPNFDDVMKLTTDHQHNDWWYALVAGLNERWSNGEGLNGLSEDFLKAMLAFDVTNPVLRPKQVQTWRPHPGGRPLPRGTQSSSEMSMSRFHYGFRKASK